jgi:outer membrane receptor protein involved in Fe transport
MRKLFYVAIALLFVCGSPALAQRPGRLPSDSSRVTQLDTVVVTPDRAASSIRSSTVAVTSLPKSWIRALPFRSVGDALAIAPGIAVVDASSIGGNPRIIARGFYGGGETDYLSAQIDGVPIAALGTGAVDWDMLPAGAFSRVELVRGATSSIHGDAAVGGTLNALIPIAPGELSWRAAGGAYGVADASLRTTHVFGETNAAEIAGEFRSSNGYRTGENRAASNLHAKIERYGSSSSLGAFILVHGRDYKDPGPLLASTVDRRAQNPFFRFDNAADRIDRVGITGTRLVGAAKLSGYVTGEYATSRAVKTLPLSTDFADTKLRRTKAPRIMTSGQLELGDDDVGALGRLVAGVDATAGRLTSRYADIVTGDGTAYASSDGAAGPEAPPSRASRASVAGFLNWQIRPVAPLRFSLSTRLDHLSDEFVPSSASGGNTQRETHDAVSPRAAVNFALPTSQQIATNAFVAVGRAFKAPTLDQLFDDRRIPIPIPPFSATVSNPDLVPQRGTAVEGGVYETWRPAEGAHVDWSVTVYQQKMQNELDFDVNTFRYINIGRSRHRGAELGVVLEAPRRWFAFGNFTQQQVLAENGPNDGKQLKAIPRRIASAGVNATIWRGLTASAVATSLTGAFVDDQNLVPLAGFTRLDARVGVPFGPTRLTLDLLNAFNRRYDATAFPDPAGSAAVYRYPAAGRFFVVGLESR